MGPGREEWGLVQATVRFPIPQCARPAPPPPAPAAAAPAASAQSVPLRALDVRCQRPWLAVRLRAVEASPPCDACCVLRLDAAPLVGQSEGVEERAGDNAGLFTFRNARRIARGTA